MQYNTKQCYTKIQYNINTNTNTIKKKQLQYNSMQYNNYILQYITLRYNTQITLQYTTIKTHYKITESHKIQYKTKMN